MTGKFPNWDHSEGIYRPEPNISEQLDAALADDVFDAGEFAYLPEEVNEGRDFGPVSEDDD